MKTNPISDICSRLKPCGRILEQDGWNVWCCSPIYGEDGRVHVFYSRWQGSFNNWVANCEVGHAVADRPEGPYKHVGIVLAGRGGDTWDSWSIHNPTVHKVGNRYALFYMGSDGSRLDIGKEDLADMSWTDFQPYYHKLVETKRIGLAIADNLDGPWKRISDINPLLDCGAHDAWDGVLVSNPAFVCRPNGNFMLYYKGMDFASRQKHFGNRKIGLAIADQLEGPYRKVPQNPLISFEHISIKRPNLTQLTDSWPENYPTAQVEDPYIWYENGRFRALMRDMGFFNHNYGILLESNDGINWPLEPQIAFRESTSYINEPYHGLAREGRLERPQLLMKDGRPDYLFCALRGGEFCTSSGMVFKIAREGEPSSAEELALAELPPVA